MKKSHHYIQWILLSIVCAIFACIVYGTIRSMSSYNEKSLEMIEESIRKSAMTCYSVEGYYPADISYLEAHYGLVLDKKRVNVLYQSLGSNLFPDIMVTYKRDGS